MSPRFVALPMALACALGLVVSTAHAQAPTDDADIARAQFKAGTKAYAEQRYAEAALAFEAAADAKPSPMALISAAQSWDLTNAPDRAADDYARALALGGLPADKAGQAKDRLAVLEGTLGAVAVTGADGTRVQLDANSERPVPATLHGSAGVHTLTVRATGGAIERRSLVLDRGKTATLDLTTAPPEPTGAARSPAAAPPLSPPPPAERSRVAPSDWRTPVGAAVTGVGGATLLAGVLLGFEANDAKNAYVAAPAHATYDHASALQTWTDVAFIAGGVITAAGVGLILWPALTSHSSDRSPDAAPAEVSLSVLPGGMLLKGAF